MSRNSIESPLPAQKFEPPATATVEMTEIDGMENNQPECADINFEEEK